MKKKTINRCPKCALPETYPGIRLDKDAKKCNYCKYYDMHAKREKLIKRTLKKEFIKTIEEKKKKNRSKYDCIVAYSGGKDSTFLLYFLKKRFNLRILAHTLDNGFISKKALENIKKITKKINIDHKFTRPDFVTVKEIFARALCGQIPYPKEIRAMLSSVCATCLGMVFGSTLNVALGLKIPIMFVGFTPGQYPAISLENFLKVKSCVFLSEKIYKDDPLDVLKVLRDPVDERFGGKIDKYFFKSQYIKRGLKPPVILFPFHTFIDYNESKILKEIAKLGWERPDDTDPCSSNCLLNALGNYSTVKRLGYHPYIGEMSLLVRDKKLSYKEAIKAESLDENSFAMTYSLKKLGLTKKQLQ